MQRAKGEIFIPSVLPTIPFHFIDIQKRVGKSLSKESASRQKASVGSDADEDEEDDFLDDPSQVKTASHKARTPIDLSGDEDDDDMEVDGTFLVPKCK